MYWMLLPLKRYADFSGRSRRKEYWMFALGQFILAILFTVLMVVLGASAASADSPEGGAAGVGILSLVLIIYCLGIIIPSLAVQVRRFHD